MVTVLLAFFALSCGGQSEHEEGRWIEPTSSETSRTPTDEETTAEDDDVAAPESGASTPDESAHASAEERACGSDEDCTLSTFDDCCGCPSPRYAISVSALEERQAPCAAVDCMDPDCPERISTLSEAAEAQCVEGLCQLVDRPE